ncbi:MAG: thioredoxin family protein [Pyrinomonadaceae bacterium MAG19_C2-C3]|nr:thioredoxin family protein [Pyrinomonadaceae bacterium MAG19_C2-C3]
MKPRFFTFALVILAAICCAASFTFNHTFAASTLEANVGATVADFKLLDASGKQHSLSSLKGAKGTALIFVSTQCPVSNAYNERMAKLAADYKAKGITVVGINSNKAEDAATITKHAGDNGLSFVILKDAGNKIADQLGAQVTPEVFLLDASNKVVYRGRIDDARNGTNITANDTRDAMDAVIAGTPVKTAQAKAFGCSIKRVAE